MRGINKVFVAGNLTRDPETHGSTVSIAIATNEVWTDRNSGDKKEHTEYHDVKLFGKTGELVAQHCGKGDAVHVTGKIRTETWDDKNTGDKRSKKVVIGMEVEFLSRAGGGGSQPQQSSPPSQRQSAPQQDKFDDDIPF